MIKFWIVTLYDMAQELDDTRLANSFKHRKGLTVNLVVNRPVPSAQDPNVMEDAIEGVELHPSDVEENDEEGDYMWTEDGHPVCVS